MEAGARRGNGGAGNHYRVGCSGKHFRGPGRQKPSRAGGEKSSRRESEVPGEEGEDVKVQKKKVIRVESEETQEYLKKEIVQRREESEVRTFVPSAVGVPHKKLFRFDKQVARSRSASGSWRLSWLMKVMKHTPPTCVRSVSTNTCRQKEKTAVKRAVESSGGKEGVPRKDVENGGKRTICKENVGAFSSGKTVSEEVQEKKQRQKRRKG